MAADSTKISITGTEEMKAKLAKIGMAVAGAKAQAALRAGGQVIVNSAKARAPYRTGNLRRSIGQQDGPGELEVTIGTDVEYAPFLEYGTSRMSPRPFMRPAFDEDMPEAIATMTKAFNHLIADAAS